MSHDLTDQAMRMLLIAVGADPAIDTPDFDTSFEELGLDSLARTELAARIKELTGVDVEDDLSASTTPGAVHTLVRDRPDPSGYVK